MKFFQKALVWGIAGIFLAISVRGFAAEKGNERVRIAVSSKSLGFLDVWAAREKGFFRRHGLDAEVIAMRPPLAIAALQAGEIDYSFGASTVLRASISGLPVKLVSLGLRSTFHTLVAKPGIKSIPELRGGFAGTEMMLTEMKVSR